MKGLFVETWWIRKVGACCRSSSPRSDWSPLCVLSTDALLLKKGVRDEEDEGPSGGPHFKVRQRCLSHNSFHEGDLNDTPACGSGKVWN